MRLTESQISEEKSPRNGNAHLPGYGDSSRPTTEDREILEDIEDNPETSTDSTNYNIPPDTSRPVGLHKDHNNVLQHQHNTHPGPEEPQKMGKGGNDATENGTNVDLSSSVLVKEMPFDQEMNTVAVVGDKDSQAGSNTKLTSVNHSCFHKFTTEAELEIEIVQERHITDKCVFVLAVVTLLLLAYCVVTVQWLLPYYYTVSLPILILIRIFMYWKNKWQYFLIDLCYFGNTLLFIAIWAAPDVPEAFCVAFGLAIGPLAWAIPVFRNSIVFHSVDKMTSSFIHFLPLLLTYNIRWNSSVTSLYWYKPFMTSHNEDVSFMFIWLVAVPFGFFVLHNWFYLLFVFIIMKPGPEYLNTYNYLTENKVFSNAFKVLGPKYKGFLFFLTMYIYTLLTLLFGILLYKYFIAHTIFVAVCLLMALWNGASFYLDVFAYKGYKAES